jgi:hypothetical protein
MEWTLVAYCPVLEVIGWDLGPFYIYVYKSEGGLSLQAFVTVVLKQ